MYRMPNGGGDDYHHGPKFSLEALGIADFDMTKSDFGHFSHDKGLLKKVNSSEKLLGAHQTGWIIQWQTEQMPYITCTLHRAELEDLKLCPMAFQTLKKQQLLNT